MGKLYVITEENYLEVLGKLQRICNKWRMLEKYQCFKTNRRTKKERYDKSLMDYECKSWGWRKTCDYKDGEWEIGNEYFCNSKFIHPTQHVFRQEYEANPNNLKEKQWIEYGKPMIHINIGISSAICLSVGDKVQFEKYGFAVYTDNSFTNRGNVSTVFKHLYVIDRVDGKITDLNGEIDKREQEWEEDAKWWDEQYEKELEKEYYEGY